MRMTVKYTIVILVLLLFGYTYSYGQKKQCLCGKDPVMNEATTDCETIKLKNGTRLYWQYNCKRIWYTLQNPKGRKIVIDEMPVDLFGYTFRLGFHFIKEFKKGVLFRGGCPANGPCNYTLIDKNNGRLLKSFDQLIQIDTDIFSEPPHPYEYNFVVYFSEKYDRLKIFYIDTKRTLSIPFVAEKNGFDYISPEYQFKKMILKGSLLTLRYVTVEKENRELRIDLKTGKYGRYRSPL